MDWNDKNKAEVIEKYKAANPTAENSSEIVATIVEDLKASGEDSVTVNGVRQILSRAKIYITIKKASATETKEKKETKQESLDRLTAAIEAQGLEADDTVIGKLTGKAAAYFADTIGKIVAEEDDATGE